MNSKRPYYVGLSDEGADSSVRSIVMNEETWLDMKCPSTITVTAEVGDTLNEDEQ